MSTLENLGLQRQASLALSGLSDLQLQEVMSMINALQAENEGVDEIEEVEEIEEIGDPTASLPPRAKVIEKVVEVKTVEKVVEKKVVEEKYKSIVSPVALDYFLLGTSAPEFHHAIIAGMKESLSYVSPPNRTVDARDIELVHEVGVVKNSVYKYKFRTYARDAFAAIRKMSGVSHAEFVQSCIGDDLQEYGKQRLDGTFVYQTGDGRYLLQSMTKLEHQNCRKFLPDLDAHWKRFPNSLITRPMGLYSIELNNKRSYFCYMVNTLDTSLNFRIKYELKGSALSDRTGTQGDAVMKDNDFTDAEGALTFAKGGDQKKFVTQLIADCKLLARLGTADYHILLGISDQKASMDKSDKKHTELSCISDTGPHGKGTYFMGMENIFLPPNVAKKSKGFMRSLKKVKKSETAAESNPAAYAERMIKFFQARSRVQKTTITL